MKQMSWLVMALAATVAQAAGLVPQKMENIFQQTQAPLVTFRLLFQTGSAFDPAGKEGVTSLTAAMLAKGGSQSLSYEEITKAMYPLATSFEAQTDKELTVFRGTTHADNLDRYYGLIRQMLLEPGFRDEDFARLRSDAMNYLKVSLREGNDEELGKEQLYNTLYRGHAYGHHNSGTVSSLEKMTIQDVKDCYARQFTRGNIVIGLAGGFPNDFPARIKQDFDALPAGKFLSKLVVAPSPAEGRRVEIIQRETRSTAISFGFPIQVRRGDKDWPALAVAASFLGQHRSSNSHLYQRLREARGLNYGDYAYIEYFPRGMYLFRPDPNLARQQQIFQIWIRPVPPEAGQFALRAGLFEFEKLIQDGLSKDEFESTRAFLSKYAGVLLQTADAQLGYALDSEYYGIPPFSAYLREALAKLTLADVNEAIRRHLTSKNLQIVVVTKEADALAEALRKGLPSRMVYSSPKPKEILDEDKLIEKHPLHIDPDKITVLPVTQAFQ